MPSIITLLSLALSAAKVVTAGYSSSSTSNIAIYWGTRLKTHKGIIANAWIGQNSYGEATGAALSQQRLSYYCASKF